MWTGLTFFAATSATGRGVNRMHGDSRELNTVA
jgi:hypothetical protein